MKTTKRTLWKLLIVCIALMMSIGGTIAYLTDTDGDVNVMTLGRVDIELIEKERVPGSNPVDYRDFQDNHPLIPGVYPGLETGNDGFWQDSVHNAVDKIVWVENTGNTDAYVRLWFAFEVTGEQDFFQDKIHLNRNQDENAWDWDFLNGTLEKGGEQYVVATATYPHVLPKGESTPVSLRQVLLDFSATNEEVAALGEKYNILVVAQGVQAAGFSSAETALTSGFGEVSISNHPFANMTTGESYVEVNKAGLANVLNNLPNGAKGKEKVTSVTFGRLSEYSHVVEQMAYQPVNGQENTGLLPALFATAYADEKGDVVAYYLPENDGYYHVYILSEGAIKLHKDCDKLMGDFGKLEVFTATNLDASDVEQMKHFFQGCNNLTVVTVPDGVEIIPEDMFANSGSLTVIEFPESVKKVEINPQAFSSKKEDVYLIVVPGSPAEQWGQDEGYNTTNWPFTWWNEGDYIHITKYIGTAAEVVVPAEIEGLPVEVLGVNAFATMAHLNVVTSVQLPDTLRRADYGVFIGCDKLRSISIPASLSYIPQDFLCMCKSLESITIPEGVVKIESGAFSVCENLKSVSIPRTVTHIGYQAFSGCSNLESVTLSNGLTHIGQEAFSGTKVRSLTIPNTVTWLGDSAFAGMKELRELTIPSSVKDFGANCLPSSGVTLRVTPGSEAEQYCKENALTYTLTSGTTVYPDPDQMPKPTTTPAPDPDDADHFVYETRDGYVLVERYEDFGAPASHVTVPGWLGGNPVRVLSSGSFNFKPYLQSVTLPDGLWEIKQTALASCESLTSIDLPDTIINIGREAFSGCFNLQSIHIPTGISSLNEGVFRNCRSLRTVTIPGNVKRIDREAFRDCSGLEEIIIEEGVQTIATKAFQNCTNLKTINIPKSVTSIRSGAFDGSNLVRITVYENSVGHEYCVDQRLNYRLLDENGKFIEDSDPTPVPTPVATPVVTPDPNADPEIWYGATEEIPFDWSKNSQYATIRKYRSTDPNVVVPSELGGLPVRVLGVNAFSAMEYIQTVELPDTLTRIEDYVFNGAKYMTRCDIPENVTYIGEGTFFECYALESVVIPAGVTEITEGAFGQCRSLTSVTVPGTVKKVGNRAFHSCSNLTNVVFENGVETIGAEIFYACGSVNVTFPTSVREIGPNIFIHCGPSKAYVYEDSKAHTLCAANNIPYEFITGAEKPIPTPKPTLTPDPGRVLHGPTDAIPFTWYNKGDHIEIAQYKGTAVNVTVPDKIDGVPVTVIRANAFEFRNDLLTIKLPANLTTIEEKAFYEVNNATTCDIPATVTSIGKQAFFGCNKLTTVVIPAGVTEIPEEAFGWCSSLTSVTIPSSVKTLGMKAFRDCHSLPEITIPATVTSIGQGTFESCGMLQATVYDGSAAHEHCHLNSIPYYLLDADGNIIQYPFPNPGGGEGGGTDDMQWFDPTEAIPFVWCVIDGHAEIHSYEEEYGGGRTHVEVPAQLGGYPVEVLRVNAFCQKQSVQTITLPSTLKIIEGGVFVESTNLTTVNIPEGVTRLDDMTFYDTGLTSAVIPAGVTKIEGATFAYCEDLTRVTMTDKVKAIAANAFEGCTNLTIHAPKGSYAEIWCKQNGVNFSSTGTVSGEEGSAEYPFTSTHDFPFCGSRWGNISVQLLLFDAAYNDYKDTVEIPATFDGAPVTTLMEEVFKNDGTVKTVIIHNGNTWIADNAFEGSAVTTICAPAGGAVETWCKNHGFNFQPLTTN